MLYLQRETRIHGFLHQADLSLSPRSVTPPYLFISQTKKCASLIDRQEFIPGFIAMLRSIGTVDVFGFNYLSHFCLQLQSL